MINDPALRPTSSNVNVGAENVRRKRDVFATAGGINDRAVVKVVPQAVWEVRVHLSLALVDDRREQQPISPHKLLSDIVSVGVCVEVEPQWRKHRWTSHSVQHRADRKSTRLNSSH